MYQNTKIDDYKNCLKKLQVKLDSKSKFQKTMINEIYKMYQNNKQFLIKNRIIQKLEQRLRSNAHNSSTMKISKIAISSGDDKIIQTINCTKTFPSRISKKILK